MNEPVAIGTFLPADVTFLMQEIEGSATADYTPTSSYVKVVQNHAAATSDQLARLCADLGDRVVAARGDGVVLASVARAGTPFGVLVKRWLLLRHGIDAPHYGFSVGASADENALRWLCDNHPAQNVQFIDGWTSKGTVQDKLNLAVTRIGQERLDPELGVIADVGSCVRTFATREDILLPTACMGAETSGLLGRSSADPELIGGDGFHGVTVRRDLATFDLTGGLLDSVTTHLASRARVLDHEAPAQVRDPDYRGKSYAASLVRRYSAADIDLINIGASESARGLIRRVPRLLLLRTAHVDHHPDLLPQLAEERRVPVVSTPDLPFQAVLI